MKASKFIRNRRHHGGDNQSLKDNKNTVNNLEKQCETHRIQTVEKEKSLADYTLKAIA